MTTPDWKIREIIQKAIESKRSATPQSIEAEANRILKGPVPAGTLQKFLDGDTSPLREDFLAVVGHILGLKLGHLHVPSRRPSFDAASSRKGHSVSAASRISNLSKSPEKQGYIQLDDPASQRLSEAVRKRINNSGCERADINQALGLIPDPLIRLLNSKSPTFHRKLQDKFVDLCAFLNTKNPRIPPISAEEYLLELLHESKIGPPGEIARKLMAISAIHNANWPGVSRL